MSPLGTSSSGGTPTAAQIVMTRGSYGLTPMSVKLPSTPSTGQSNSLQSHAHLAPHERINPTALPPVVQHLSELLPFPSRNRTNNSHNSLAGPFIRPEPPQAMFEQLVIIGEGESGDVFCADTTYHDRSAAIDPAIVDKVAIKVVRLPTSREDASANRLENLSHELSLWRACAHDRILTVYDCFFEPTVGVWITQELMDRSLADVIAVRSEGIIMSEPQMARILHDALTALEHLHAKQVLHRDCRSDNVMITAEGVAKLSDFTHACVVEQKRRSVVGTPFWMAPEVIKASPYDAKADIWSLGVVLYEMLEGDPPRVELPPLRAITLTATVGLPPLSEPEKYSQEAKEILARCTEMEPTRRPSAAEVLKVSARGGGRCALFKYLTSFLLALTERLSLSSCTSLRDRRAVTGGARRRIAGDGGRRRRSAELRPALSPIASRRGRPL